MVVREADIPQLTDSFHKTRRNYGFFCAILLAWEMFGIEMGSRPIPGYDITLREPKAMQIILIVLIIYFAFRMTVEWNQSSDLRRRRRASKIDFYSAHMIGFFSISAYTYQQFTNVNIASSIGNSLGYVFVTLILISSGLVTGHILYISVSMKGRWTLKDVLPIFFILFASWMFVFKVIAGNFGYHPGLIWLLSFVIGIFYTVRQDKIIESIE